MDLSPQVLELASLVALECDGLPLGIIVAARCMREVNDVCEWRDALRALMESKAKLEGMDEDVFKVLMFSYCRLNDPQVQQSFLYCALYPEDHTIGSDILIQRLIDEGVIGGVECRQAQFDRGYAILNKLVNSCLLEQVEKFQLTAVPKSILKDGFSWYEREDDAMYVKMHDLVRDMALNMSPQLMVKAGEWLEEIPKEQEWSKDVERASLMENHLQVIAADTSRTFPKLSTLLLSDNYHLKTIDNSFFEHMATLQVLDLSNCWEITKLPDSVSNLKNLIVLVLNRCFELKSVPSLAKMSSLKRLDLCNTAITEVPHGLERLVRLTYLDLQTTHLIEFPTGILPQMLLLEVLMFADVKIKGEELKKLEGLSTFRGKLVFDDANGFKSYVMSRRRYRGPNCSYYFGLDDSCMCISEEYKRDGNLHHLTLSIPKKDVDVEMVEALLQDVQSLELDEWYGAPNLCDISWLDNPTHNLKRCHLNSCKGMQCLVSCSCSSSYFLQKLEILTLEDLDDLEVLFELGRAENDIPSSSTMPPPPILAVTGGVFSCLKVLALMSCNKIEMLFHPSFLPNLRNLQQIEVYGCKALQEIIATSEGETNTSIEHALPHLQTLNLIDLPELKSICAETISCDSLCEIIVSNCPQLKRIPLSDLPSSFQSFRVQPEQWWESAEWDHPDAKDLFQPYLKTDLDESE